MKLITYVPKKGGHARFGFVDEDSVFSFPDIASWADYLKHFPASEKHAHEIFRTGKGKDELPASEVRFLPPVENIPMLLDFSLAPQHLSQAFDTLLKHEYGWFTRRVVRMMMKSAAKKKQAMGMLDYYKANHHALSGDGDTVEWPDYTGYLDVEGELSVVIGTHEHPIVGYMIMNDWSARDVQLPELSSTSLTRSKDFNKSYGLGPYLVTPDEVPNPLQLTVEVSIADRYHWQGSTSAYTASPEQAIEYLRTIFEPVPGTVFGMGTVTGCCGLEHDLWLEPGDEVRISIEKLGTLRQWAPKKAVNRNRSRWGAKL